NYDQALSMEAPGLESLPPVPATGPTLILKCIAAKLRGGEDDDGIARISRICPAGGGAEAVVASVRDLLSTELQRRLAASDGAGVLRLLDKTDPLAERFGAAFSSQSQTIRRDALALRENATDEEIDRLVGQVGASPDAERRLLDLGARA